MLELAAGTGIVTRKLRDLLADGVRLVASDLNPPMLEVAQAKFGAREAVEFQPADAMNLPFEDDEFDLLVSQFGVMFFPDKPASYREAWRVLQSGGSYLFNVWGSLSDNPFAAVADEIARRFFPDDPPGFYKVPFGYSDPAAVEADLAAGGFEHIVHETIALNKEVHDWTLFAHGLVCGNPLIEEIENRGRVSHEAVVSAMATELREVFGNEPAHMPLLATVYEARKT